MISAVFAGVLKAGVIGFTLWTIFIFILYVLVNSLLKETEKFYKIGVHIHLYDYFLFVALMFIYVYGFFINGSK